MNEPVVRGPAPAARASGRSVLWALVPLISLGILAPVTIGHAAVRLRSRAVAVSAGVYAACVAVLFVGANAFGPHPPGLVRGVIAAGVLGAWLGGTVQAFALRRRVFMPDPGIARNHAARKAALRRRELRSQARQLAEDNPVLAYELRIGRPDEPRAYDDGGLIAVNQVPAPVLTGLPGIDAVTAGRIVELRGQRGPFVSCEDLLVAAGLPPHLLGRIAEYALFLP